MNALLKALQDAVTEFLRGKHELVGISVLSQQDDPLDDRFDGSVQSALGLSIAVLPPVPRKADSGLPGPVLTEIVVEVRVVENYYTNELSADAQYVAERITRWLHQWTPPVPQVIAALSILPTKPWEVERDVKNSGQTIIEITFITSATFVPVPA